MAETQVKISDMDPKSSLEGAEIFPMADVGSPKSATTNVIRQFVVAAIEAISAGATATSSDMVYLLKGGNMKPVPLDVVSQRAIDIIWGKAAEASPAGANTIPLKSGGDEKTVTLTALAAFVRGAIEGQILDVSDLTAATLPLSAGDNFLVTQGTTGRKVTHQNIVDGIYSALSAHVTSRPEVTATADADTFYVVQGGTAKKVTLQQILAHAGSPVTGPGNANPGVLAVWADANEIGEGPNIVTVLDGATDETVPTAKAVSDKIAEVQGEIPDAQVQADWDQSNDAEVDFIKNKPAIPDVPQGFTIVADTAELLASHFDKLAVVASKGTALTLSLKTQATESYPAEGIIKIANAGAGALTVQAPSGVTINGEDGGAIQIEQYEGGDLIRIADNEWLMPNLANVIP